MKLLGASLPLERLVSDLFTDETREAPFRALVREHQYYYIKDEGLVIGIQKLKHDDAVVKGIRNLYEQGQDPFAPEEMEVQVSFASDSKIPRGHAAVCPNGNLFRKELWLTALDGGALVVSADLQGPCRNDQRARDNRASIQISFADARSLYGCTPLQKEERALAVERRFPVPSERHEVDCARGRN
jgi:hypothetical protein